jgi:hypothetical protein
MSIFQNFQKSFLKRGFLFPDTDTGIYIVFPKKYYVLYMKTQRVNNSYIFLRSFFYSSVYNKLFVSFH